jgi:phosphohistidine phosphatase
MDLLLWRHADASPAESGADSARRLTGKGKKQAQQMAAWLDRHLPEGARIISSPASRALETAEALAALSGRKLSVRPEVGVGSLPAHLLIAAGWPDNRHPVVIVGHQPALGRLASLLLSGEEREMSVRKGSVWWFTTRERKSGAYDIADGPDQHGGAFKPVALRIMMCPEFL